jgi:hypothetical protein
MILVWCCFCAAFTSFSQVAPALDWRKITHSPKGLNGQAQTFEQSGEEWWYSHKNVYNASGVHESYVTVGYTSLVSTLATFTAAQEFFNEGPNSPYNPINSASYNYNSLPEGCSDRDYLGEHRTPPRGNIGLNGLDGEMIYCKPKTIGALEEVIQDEQNKDYFYVVGVHHGVRPYKNKTDFIPYNPDATGALNYFSLSSMGLSAYSNDIGHIYVAKIHINGNVIWEGLYGYKNYSDSPIAAYETGGYGYDLIKSSNGNIIVTGFVNASGALFSASCPVLLEIEAATGYITKKTLLPNTGNGIGPKGAGTCYSGQGKSLVEISGTGSYAVACTYYYENCADEDKCNAYIWNVNQNFSPSPYWPNNPVKIAGPGPYFSSNIWEIKYHSGLNQIMAGVVRDCFSCTFAGQNSANGYIYRFDQNGVLVSQGVNPSPMGPINAFDLRVGVEQTSDGGFAAVSATRPPGADHSPATPEELGYLSSCPDLDFANWDSDALVVKYDANGAMKWSKTFDVEDNRRRLPPPQDFKRQECMYKITEAQRGGYVISGNSSGNFDDFYMAKLQDDCNALHTFTTGPNNVLTITGNVLWDSSLYVIGKIIVEAGASFTIKGPTTRIRFADSKLTGIETNLTVLPGAILNVTDGAQLSAIDDCKNSSWDGIQTQGLSAEGSSFFLFPNPAAAYCHMLYTGSLTGEITYSLLDVFGKVLRNGLVRPNLASEIDTETFSSGVYFITLSKDNSVFEKQKLIVTRE